jgi:hypothetical protein
MNRSFSFLSIAACLAAGCAASDPKGTPEDFDIVAGDEPSDAYSRRVLVQGELDFGLVLEADYPSEDSGYLGWSFAGLEDQVVTVAVNAVGDSDSVVSVYGPQLGETWSRVRRLAENDDFGGTRNSRVELTLPRDGNYLIVVREYSGGSGRFELSLECSGSACRTPADDAVACEVDSDCVAIRASCCPCSMGGEMRAVNREHEDAVPACDISRPLRCPAVYSCNDEVPACVSNRCELVPPAPAEGEHCGGLAGLACADGSYCHYEEGAMCGAADQTGTCREIPTGACTREYRPVCGCDGRNYGNPCSAEHAGTSVAHEGNC